jgi:hypothetical protein
MAEANQATTIFVAEKQTPAEKRMALSFMINMLSQTNDKHGDKLLPEWVNHLAEVLIMTGEQKVPTKGMVAQLLTRYNNGDILKDDLRKMISIISDHVFDDSTESRAKSRTVEQSDSDSDQDEPPQRQVQVKGDSKQGLSKFFDKVLQTAASDEDDDAANEAFFSKLVDLLPKFDKSHMVALVKYHAMASECREDQGRAAQNILKSIDSSMKSMVVYPHHDTIKSQNDIQRMQGSLALTCLMKNIYGQDHTASPKQLKQLEARAKLYATTTDMQKFKQDFITERAIYNKVIQLFGRRQDVESKKSELDICEILLQQVFTQDQQLAKDLQRRLEAKPPITLDEVLNTLVQNRRIEEGLGESPVSKRGSSSTKSADKKDGSGKQPVANAATQQKCPICTADHDVTQCPKLDAQLKRSDLKRGEKLPGGTTARNPSKRNSQQVADAAEEETAPNDFQGCVICFALGRNAQACMSHNEKRCYNKRAFEKQMQDPMALLTSLAAKSHAERVDKASGGSNSQPQTPRNARADRRGQPSHGSPAMQNPAAQSQLQTQQSMQQMQQMTPQVFREPYPQQTMMMQQPSSDFVYPWQLQSMQDSVSGGQSLYNSGQYLQSATPQSGPRHAHLSQTMVQSNTGEGPQIQFFEP